MINLTYLTSSSYSGSTLFTFLVNQHPKIFTIGELEGWKYGEDEDYRCSCGETLIDCGFFSSIAEAYSKNGILYNPRNFGTNFRLVKNERLNRYLTQNIASISNSYIENFRDEMMWKLPISKGKLQKSSLINEVFVRQALNYSKAKVFIDATKSPFRLRHLKRTNVFNLKTIYLVRDPRGQVLSNITKKPMTVEVATRIWLRDQANICRVLNEFPKYFLCHYEDLCADVQKTLNDVYKYLEVDESSFSGNFRQSEHHILGNDMRINNTSEVKSDIRWHTELSRSDRGIVEQIVLDYAKKNPSSPETKLIYHYIN